MGNGSWVLVGREKKTPKSVKRGTERMKKMRKHAGNKVSAEMGISRQKPERQVQEAKVRAEQREAQRKGKQQSE